MNIAKILNNNVITVIDEDEKEKVVMGKGLAFGKRSGDMIDTNKIEKVFSLENEVENKRFQQLINEVPIEHIRVAEEIISLAKKELELPFDEHIYVALTDHLTFAIKRAQTDLTISNPLLLEIKRMHPKEYEIGLKGTNIINDRFHLHLNEDEAGFIALHLVNASKNKTMETTMDTLNLVQEIVKIIKYHFSIDIDTSDISYSRLMTHLRYFSERVLKGEMIQQGEDELYELIKAKYKKSFECVIKIKTYIEKRYTYTLSKQELLYLMLHVRRVISRINSNGNT